MKHFIQLWMAPFWLLIGFTGAHVQAQTGVGDRNGQRSTHLVPVVVHIIHYHGQENISDAQVQDAIRILNEDFNKQNPEWITVRPEFLDLVSDVGIEFRLAQLDPDGNCTNGITHTVSPLTFTGYQAMRDLIQWPPERYMNIWVNAVITGVVTGVPPPPDPPVMPAQAELMPEADGVMIKHDFFGTVGTSQYSHRSVLTHRVGHYLNLYHTWGPNAEPGQSSNCQLDDGVDDTPSTWGNVVCNTSQSTCGSLDNVENFMEYSFCQKMFTHGQKARMLAALNSPIAQRNNLITEENHDLTGILLDGIVCKADFLTSSQEICAGGSVTFSDVSYHGITERWWNFTGGLPENSVDSSVTVTYPQSGAYDITLTVTDGVDTLSLTRAAYLNVQEVPGVPSPIVEGFEDLADLDDSLWKTIDPDADGSWQITSLAAATGIQSVMMAHGPEAEGRFDELISPPIDMTGAATMNINFRFASARRSETSDDRLVIHTSNDCGLTWQPRATLIQHVLATGGTVADAFIPTSDQWGYREINNIIHDEFSGAVRVKFKFTQRGGNHLYLDDINIFGSSVGMADGRSAIACQLIPNPARDAARLMIDVVAADEVIIDILDATGRTIHSVGSETLRTGRNHIELPVGALVPGTYLVRVHSKAIHENLRLVIQ
jgi:PKD repeat protein